MKWLIACFVAAAVLIGTKLDSREACLQPAVGSLDRTGESSDTADTVNLARQSRSPNRDEWWPAVARLGEAAAASAESRELAWMLARVNTLGMKFSNIPAGAFTMGPDYHTVWDPKPAHEVVISKGFSISITEVTNEQMERLFPEFKRDTQFSPDPDSPAVNVSWEMAREFCVRLSEAEGEHYRLPTEAEWEYACRAGSTTLYSFGTSAGDLAAHAWYGGHNEGRASRVALLKPNAWGIFDMHGNAVEWVADLYSRTYYAEQERLGVSIDPAGPATGWGHVLRGGGWPALEPSACSSTARMPFPLLGSLSLRKGDTPLSSVTGFRVVCDPRD